ncbi:MAG: hypothetical protein AAF333_11085 [Planctomycetota bacterium]
MIKGGKAPSFDLTAEQQNINKLAPIALGFPRQFVTADLDLSKRPYDQLSPPPTDAFQSTSRV